jgi:hypothetical protein
MTLPHEYIEQIRQLRRKKKLHGYVEDRLIELLQDVAPNLHPIKEPQGVAGGRNDLMLFEFTGKKVLFEIFATKSQVSRDLWLLERTKAEIKIAIVIDKQVDPGVFEEFCHKNPEHTYPFLFIHELLEPSFQYEGRLRLWELIMRDDESRIRRLLTAKVRAKAFVDHFRESGADVLTPKDIETGTVMFKKVFVTCMLKKLHDWGLREDVLRKFAAWFSRDDLHRYLVLKLHLGYNMYLYTDLAENFDVLSDHELLQWLFVGHKFSETYILLSLNATVREVIDMYLKDTDWATMLAPVQFTIGLSRMIEESDGRVMVYSLPRKTKKIYLIPPMAKEGCPAELEKSNDEYRAMIEFPQGAYDSRQ